MVKIFVLRSLEKVTKCDDSPAVAAKIIYFTNHPVSIHATGFLFLSYN